MFTAVRSIRPLRPWSLALLLALAAAISPAPAAPAAEPAPRPPAAGPTDAEVVAAMKKGIDYLLSIKQNDSWEIGQFQEGGETSLVLYALLHAGQSLQDDELYSAKLAARSPDIAPALTWLSKFEPKHTYTAGLQASALALTTRRRDDKPGEGPQVGLNFARDYLLTAMGADGGYAYTGPASGDGETFNDSWRKYIDAKLAGASPRAIDDALKNLVNRANSLNSSFGGVDVALRHIDADIRARVARAKEAKNALELKRLEIEFGEYTRLNAQLPKTRANNPAAAQQALANARKQLADAEGHLNTGDLKDDYRKDDKGNLLKGSDGQFIKIRVPKTARELQAEAASARQQLANIEFNLRNSFSPIGDLSNCQYGTLGAWALDDYGLEIPTAYWQVQDRFWRFLQHADGGWGYQASRAGDSTPTMSVAGLASLYITRQFVDTKLRLIPEPDKNLEAGLALLNATFKPSDNLYYMYGIERVGLASGLKYFGTTDWYRAGADSLLKSQAPTGAWSFWGKQSVGTAYGLLFLARGRNPVVFNKLEYNGPWDARPRDSANLTRWVSKAADNRPINWQSVNLKTDPEDWLDAPILLITGSQDPKFTPAEIAKLRVYIEAGGTIFSTADGGKKEFTEAIRRSAAQVARNKYEMRELPPTHTLFTHELWADIKNPPPMLGMSNGVRDFWVHSTVDMGATWQQQKFAAKDHFEIPFNLYFYATGKGTLRSKLASLAIAPTTQKAVRTIALARLDHVANADPEPGAWPRMARLAPTDFNTQLTLTTVQCSQLDPQRQKIAHMTGTTRFQLNDADTAALKAYLDGGGLLFADAAGGAPDFTASLLNLLKTLYPNDPPQPLLPEHPLLQGWMTDAQPITTIKFRRFGDLQLGRRLTAPRLDAITSHGRITVIFSPYDLTSGLLGTSTWGILGYSPESAQDIVRNVLLYAAAPQAATRPAASQPAASQPAGTGVVADSAADSAGTAPAKPSVARTATVKTRFAFMVFLPFSETNDFWK